MKDNIIKVFIFAAGAIAGSAVTWKLVKTKYEQISNEEIESVKEHFKKMYEETEPIPDENVQIEEAEPINVNTEKHADDGKANMNVIEYAKIISKEKYSEKEVTELVDETGKGDDVMEEYGGPRVISPEEFGENVNYEVLSFTYYADGILTDEDDHVISNPEDYIGDEALNSFGEYEDDSVFVVDDDIETYYEILLDESNYSDKY